MDRSVIPLSGSVPLQFRPAHADSTFHIRDLVGALREKWLLFLLVFVLVAAPSIWVVSSLRPSYTATSKVMIEPNERMRVAAETAVTGLMLDNESVRSQVEVLMSPDLAQRVVERFLPRITKDLEEERSGPAWLIGQIKDYLKFLHILPPSPADRAEEARKAMQVEGAPEEESEGSRVLARFMKRLTVTPVERSRVITVTYRAYDAELAADVANAIATEYVDMALDFKRQGTREAAEWLARRITELQASIDASERTIEEYRKQSGLVQGDGSGLVAERLNRANIALAEVRSRIAELSARMSQLNAAGSSPDKSGEVLNSPVVQKLRQMEAELATRVAELSTTLGSASPILITARNSLAQVRRSISEETARIRDNLRKEMESARMLQTTLQGQVESLMREMSDLRTATIRLRALEREADANRAIYENVLLRTKDVVAQESFLRRDAQVIAHAVVPPQPTSLSPALLIGACIVAGLAIASLVLRVVVHFEPGYSRIRDVERATGTTVLSAIPKIRFGRKQPFEGKPFSEQRSRFAGSINMLLGRIMMGRQGSHGTVLTVTSCLPGEGKTTVTMALAHLAERIGYKCLVIDGDFRSPKLSRSLGLHSNAGLSDVLDQSRKLGEVVSRVRDSALYVLPAGQPTQRIGRLIGGESFRNLVEQLTHEYDLIIIDSSPLMAATEPQILAQIADQTLMVVRWRKTPRAVIQDGIEKLSKATNAICGIAFSQVNSGRRGVECYGDV